MQVGVLVVTLGLAAAVIGEAGAARQAATPREAVDELLAADRAFSAASARTDAVSGLSAMFADDIMMTCRRVNSPKERPAPSRRCAGTLTTRLHASNGHPCAAGCRPTGCTGSRSAI